MTDTMHSDLNPYAPGSGRKPPELSGRDAEINAFDLTIARTRKRNSSRGMVLLGLRGVGKTVLLKRFQQMAERAEWLIVEIEGTTADDGALAVRHRLARALTSAGAKFNRVASAKASLTDALSSISSFSLSVAGVSVGLGVEPNPTRANSGRIEVDLEELIADLAPALRANSTALGIFVDEMQDLDSELLSALLTVQHKAGQNDWPFFVVGAGLPSLPAILSSSKSYAERLFDYRTLGALDADRARDAVTLPAERLSVRFSSAAADEIVEAAEGYPYFLQTFAMKAWDSAIGKTIELTDAVSGIADGRLDLDMGFYPARWDRATPAERRYLVVMAQHPGGECTTSELALALDSTQQRLSTIRQGLIRKGLIYARERGTVAFTVPGMSSFVERQREVLDDLPKK
ncbi:MAG: hypothetical protein JWR04_303 [Rhodoglobus sp.]|nr:hypothetical protein [Rhodoglobus sp.]